ncbi:MAG: hypothetical protein CM15mP74_23950 [Halieaceae bacterium]|nr:MAG: hypothetical protein CM15mP74_23950 [Halieaceae bacterium]
MGKRWETVLLNKWQKGWSLGARFPAIICGISHDRDGMWPRGGPASGNFGAEKPLQNSPALITFAPEVCLKTAGGWLGREKGFWGGALVLPRGPRAFYQGQIGGRPGENHRLARYAEAIPAGAPFIAAGYVTRMIRAPKVGVVPALEKKTWNR